MPVLTMRPIYLDNAATTFVSEEVAALAFETMRREFGNPSSPHTRGVGAARGLEEARERVARAIGADPSEVTFTSGGTEANALGFSGAARAARGRHVVLSAFEHPSVLEAGERLRGEGWEVSEVAPEPSGVVSVEKFAAALRPDTAVAALMWVQNEIGTVQPIGELARVIKARAPRCHFHVDGVQAAGKIPVDVSLGFDSLSLSAHKIHGPKGVGALWLRKGARVLPLVWGGGQERGLRPGTENMPGIRAFGLAIELAERARPEASPRMARLRDRLWEGISSLRPSTRRHGAPQNAAPHILSVGFPGVPAEILLNALDARALFVSAGSACHSKDRSPSATLTAIGVGEEVGTLRFSLCQGSNEDDVAEGLARLAEALKEIS
jgi:cysteine desulfurase